MNEGFAYCPKSGNLEIVRLERDLSDAEAPARITSCTGYGNRKSCDQRCTRFWINRYIERELNQRLEYKPAGIISK
jgi:hypothetical protein